MVSGLILDVVALCAMDSLLDLPSHPGNQAFDCSNPTTHEDVCDPVKFTSFSACLVVFFNNLQLFGEGVLYRVNINTV